MLNDCACQGAVGMFYDLKNTTPTILKAPSAMFIT